MNKWLLGLGVTAVILPLLMFVGNLKVEVPEGHAAESSFPTAPELAGISSWINSEPLRLADLKGKVVLVDFWTYSCINCIRTLPYLAMWNEKYRDSGLVIIGVHSPEFDFEKDAGNVRKAVEKYSINYAVALDNDHATWRAFQNNYWPHKYLIDADGLVRYDHVGEGGYDETERIIQELLRERAGAGEAIPESISGPASAVDVDFTAIGTPEIYLGYEYARVNLGNREGFRPGEVVSYSLPSYNEIAPNLAYVSGTWKNHPDSLELISDEGQIGLAYHAKSVNAVAGGQNSSMQVFVDGDPVNSSLSGSDLNNSVAQVDEQRLYNIISDNSYQSRFIGIDVKGRGFRIYTFTFG